MTDSSTPAPGPADTTSSGSSGLLTQEEVLIDEIGDAFAASDRPEDEEQPANAAPAAHEGEPEEATAESDEKPDDEEEAEAKPEPDDNVRVKLDGGDEVTLAELKRGFLRQSDYTRKTQELASNRKEVSAAAQRLIEADNAVRQQLELASAVIQSRLPQPPDPAKIQTDAIGYLQEKEAYERAVHEFRQIEAARAQSQERQQVAQGSNFQANLQQEMQALTEKVPEFKSPEKRTAFLKEAVDVAAKSYGLKAEEIESLVDHRSVMVLRDAIAYRKLQSEKMSAVAKAKQAPPIRPAVRQPGTREAAARRTADERLRQEGSVDAFIDALGDDLIR